MTLPQVYRDLIELWRMWRGNGMAPGVLPDAGGAADQSTWLMAAFAEMQAAAHVLEKGA